MSAGFSFGAPSSSGQSNTNATTSSAPATGGLFGSSAPSSNLFGGAKPPTSTSSPSGGFSFGNQNTTGSLFGDKQKPAGTGSPLTGGLTSPPASTSGGGMFGSKPGGLFGSSPTTAAPTTAAPNTASTTPGASSNTLFGSSSPSLFGATASTTPAPAAKESQEKTPQSGSAEAKTPAKPLFAMNSTTPAGLPPSDTSKSGGLFGGAGAKSSTSLFGSSQQGDKDKKDTDQAGGMFKLGGGTTQPSSTAGAGSSLFGNASQPAQSSPGLFKPSAEGASTGGGLFGAKPATTQSNTSATTTTKPAESSAAPATGSLFGGASAAPASSAGSSSLFGSKPSAPASTSAATPPATQTSSLFSGLNKPAASTSTPEPPKASSMFGGAAKPATTTSAPEPAKTTTSLFGSAPSSSAAAASTTATAPSTGATSSSAAPAAGSTATTTTAPATSSLFGAAKPAAGTDGAASQAAPSQNANLAASTAGPTSSMARLKNKTMDEIITRWAGDLSKYQKEFKSQASQVAAWDRLLVENGEKIQQLYLNTFEAEKASREVERNLVHVESQQQELEDWLDKYETEVDELFNKGSGSNEQLQGHDQERERTYKLAEKITERLDEMGRDLTKMIKDINEISGTVSKGSKPDDPLSQIVRVLNGHLTQLQWIDTNAAALQAKVTAAQKASSTIGNQYGGPEDNVDSFYRSYMGRR
ncbi:Nsp1-like C-terminal region-domain-containing protein [Xylariomycetidae sp. FL0641]|nr:Nsp1-like C-terminal region-domain-containing protein [Xylariomycetidae sp. FL0641]